MIPAVLRLNQKVAMSEGNRTEEVKGHKSFTPLQVTHNHRKHGTISTYGIKSKLEKRKLIMCHIM